MPTNKGIREIENKWIGKIKGGEMGWPEGLSAAINEATGELQERVEELEKIIAEINKSGVDLLKGFPPEFAQRISQTEELCCPDLPQNRPASSPGNDQQGDPSKTTEDNEES